MDFSAGFSLFKSNRQKPKQFIQKNMLKYYYESEADIPKGLKGAYEPKNGRYELKRLADDVPIVVANKSLTNTNTELKNDRTDLTTERDDAIRERDEARGKSLQSGQRAVPIEIADLGNAAKDAGFTKEDLPTAKGKLEEFETKEAQASDRANKEKAFKFAGVTNMDEAFSRKATDDLKLEWKTVDNKEQPYIVSEKDGQKTETLFDRSYLENAEGFKSGVVVLFGEMESKGFRFSDESKGKAKETSAAGNYIKSRYKRPEAASAS